MFSKNVQRRGSFAPYAEFSRNSQRVRGSGRDTEAHPEWVDERANGPSARGSVKE